VQAEWWNEHRSRVGRGSRGRSARGPILEIIKAGVEIPPGTLLMEDPPAHDIHRGLLARVFTPRRVLALEPQIRALCHHVPDRLAGAGRFDLMAEFANEVPMRVIGMLLEMGKLDGRVAFITGTVVPVDAGQLNKR
jgi:cytochrome P450